MFHPHGPTMVVCSSPKANIAITGTVSHCQMWHRWSIQPIGLRTLDMNIHAGELKPSLQLPGLLFNQLPSLGSTGNPFCVAGCCFSCYLSHICLFYRTKFQPVPFIKNPTFKTVFDNVPCVSGHIILIPLDNWPNAVMAPFCTKEWVWWNTIFFTPTVRNIKVKWQVLVSVPQNEMLRAFFTLTHNTGRSLGWKRQTRMHCSSKT